MWTRQSRKQSNGLICLIEESSSIWADRYRYIYSREETILWRQSLLSSKEEIMETCKICIRSVGLIRTIMKATINMIENPDTHIVLQTKYLVKFNNCSGYFNNQAGFAFSSLTSAKEQSKGISKFGAHFIIEKNVYA